MALYIVAFAAGYVLANILKPYTIEDLIIQDLKAGKTIMMISDGSGVIMKMENGKVRTTPCAGVVLKENEHVSTVDDLGTN